MFLTTTRSYCCMCPAFGHAKLHVLPTSIRFAQQLASAEVGMLWKHIGTPLLQPEPVITTTFVFKCFVAVRWQTKQHRTEEEDTKLPVQNPYGTRTESTQTHGLPVQKPYRNRTKPLRTHTKPQGHMHSILFGQNTQDPTIKEVHEQSMRAYIVCIYLYIAVYRYVLCFNMCINPL